MSFWSNCEHIMVEYDITQDAFARIVGVSPTSVHRWKEGSIPRLPTILSICKAFNVDRDDLLNGDLSLGGKRDELGELSYYFVSLDDEGREALLTIARQMSKGMK